MDVIMNVIDVTLIHNKQISKQKGLAPNLFGAIFLQSIMSIEQIIYV